MRPLLFVALASLLTAYAFWVYLRVELPVPVARRLAVVRAAALVVVLLLLFDPRLPGADAGGAPSRWVLLDASVSMSAVDEDGRTAWSRASERAQELESDGWSIVRFGGERLDLGTGSDVGPVVPTSRLLPALEAAAESGAREVRVLSDLRFEDAVALRAAAERLPLEVAFEPFEGAPANRGIGRFEVPDMPTPDEEALARIEVIGGAPGDSIDVEILEEGAQVATVRVAAPSPGLRAVAEATLPPPAASGRVRYTARVGGSPESSSGAPGPGDGFAADDEFVTYTNVGFEGGGLVLVSFRPDWEPRHLLPVLEDVTGLSGAGYLRAGPDRYVRSGRAANRGAPVDSATVRRAAGEAALLVLHGLGAEAEPWVTPLLASGGRVLVIPSDVRGAAAAGVTVAPAREGEWYASPDVPTSPIAGALTGVELQGLPPLRNVMVADAPNPQPVLQLQLRGAGAPENAFHLVGEDGARRVVALSSGYWRWAARDEGRIAYRSLWSGLAGWLLAGERVAAAEPRPASWTVPSDQPVPWVLPNDSASYRVSISADGATAVDTLLGGGTGATTASLPPDTYTYQVLGAAGDTVGTGRFDVVTSTLDMLPAVADPLEMAPPTGTVVPLEASGRPLRTSPLPYLLVIALLCGEWIVRRRSGLR